MSNPYTADEQRTTMRCADETGWPEREFVSTDGGVDWSCTACGWDQLSFASGCRELVTAAVWHDAGQLRDCLAEALRDGRSLRGSVRLDIAARLED